MFNALLKNRQTLLPLAKVFSISAVLITITFSLLNLNSLCVILMAAVWLYEGDFRNKLQSVRKDGLFLAFALYFLLQVIGLFYGNDFHSAWKHVESQVGFFVIPLIFCSAPIDIALRRKVMLIFTATLTAAIFYCMIVLLIQEGLTDTSRFFYHSLVSPLEHHAIYFSVFVFICLLFLIYEAIPSASGTRKSLFLCWAALLAFFLILLSSKLVLSIMVLFFVFFGVRHSIRKRKIWPLITIGLILFAGGSVILSTKNPVKDRFKDVLSSNMELLHQDRLNPGTVFTGFNLRLLFWRFSHEILREEHAYVAGVGPANVQSYLNKKYVSMDMYQGNGKGDTGYIGYNCHNQYLQSIVGSGIIGLVVLLFWCFQLFKTTLEKKEPVLWGFTFIILGFFFIESVFNRQYGVMLSTIIPLLYARAIGNTPSTRTPS